MSDYTDLPNDELDQPIPDIDFTYRANESFFDTVDHPDFQSDDQHMIYHTLMKKMKPLRFGDYLKRYIYQKAELTGHYTEIPLKDYQDIICTEFAERQTPKSFTPNKATLRNLAKNWLEQVTVNRSVVLLLGFGLGMSVDDVNDFLVKGLREAQLYSKDPTEVICWYCYEHGYGFAKFEQLWEQYSTAQVVQDGVLESTVSMHRKLMNVHTDHQLLDYLSGLPMAEGSVYQSMAARYQFDRLYNEARKLVAAMHNQAEADTAVIQAERLRDALDHNSRLYDFQKVDMVDRERSNHRVYLPEEIGPGDVEQTLFAAVPRDVHGNLVPMKASALQQQFRGKRLTRQHINQILAGKEPIVRYDLLTLHFFVFSQSLDQYESINARCSAFEASANEMLLSSGLGEFYVVNPYECFLLMCIISQDPLGTFSDVWELSYQDNED